jgi:O-acetyl-ADP-ribose deacetylase (regulator of RNase III)
MPFEIIRNDITILKVDAIVNAANETLLGGGGVDGAIHRAAGPKLLEACEKLNGCKTGEVKLTEAYNLPAKHVIHTVGPVWQGGVRGEEILLRSCYKKSLEAAVENGFESIAFPLISSGVYGYPKAQAIEVAISEITLFLESYDLTVYLVIFDREATYLSEKRYHEIKSYIDDAYVAEHQILRNENKRQLKNAKGRIKASIELIDEDEAAKYETVTYNNLKDENLDTPLEEDYEQTFNVVSNNVLTESLKERSLEDVLSQLQMTFSEQLFWLIDQKGYDDVSVYKRANIDRKLFSKIRSDRTYKPSKATVMALAISLRLSYDEASDLMQKAGYAFSKSNKQELIIRYFIENGHFDIHEINLALFEFGEPLL